MDGVDVPGCPMCGQPSQEQLGWAYCSNECRKAGLNLHARCDCGNIGLRSTFKRWGSCWVCPACAAIEATRGIDRNKGKPGYRKCRDCRLWFRAEHAAKRCASCNEREQVAKMPPAARNYYEGRGEWARLPRSRFLETWLVAPRGRWLVIV